MKFLCSSLLGLMLLGSAQAQSCGGAPEAGTAASPAPNETVAPRLTTLPLPKFLLKLNAASETADTEIWAEAMRRLAQPEQHESLLQALRKRSVFPKAPMVDLLAHAELAVRIGALELLETTAGGDHGFDPWAPDSDASTAALAFFKTWATGQEAVTLQLPVLSQSQALTWLREIISGVPERETHGLRSLEAYREQALVQVQQFATSQPDLDSKAAAKLQSARYRLLLSEVVHDGAGALAQQLVFGNRDQQLSSLGQLKKLGPKMLPIVREFVSSKDALIRETAVDVFLELGKAPALEVLHDQLRAETDRNVLQATMRQLGDLSTPKSAELLMEWAQRDDEDLIVSALDSLTKIKFGGGKDGGDLFGGGAEGKAPAKSSLKLLEGLLSHASWRVRASVLQAASKLNFKALAPKVRPLLEDADEFVRAAAVSCMGEFSDKPGLKQLQKLFETDPSLTAPIVAAWVENNQKLTEAQMKTLLERKAEFLLPLFRSLSDVKEKSSEFDLVFALRKHPDRDVSLTAWRKLASQASGVPALQGELEQALKGSDAELRQVLCANLRGQTSTEDSERRRYWERFGMNLPKPGSAPASVETNDALSALYAGFLEPLAAARGQAAPGATTLNMASEVINQKLWPPLPTPSHKAVSDAMKQLWSTTTVAEERLAAAAYVVVSSADPAVLASLVEEYPKLNIAQRNKLISAIPHAAHPIYWPLLRLAMNDVATEVRTEAVRIILYNDSDAGLVRLVLDEFSDPKCALRVNELFSYSFRSALGDAKSQPIILDWARHVGTQKDLPADRQLLRLIVLGKMHAVPGPEMLTQFLESTSPWMRRTALWTAARMGPQVMMKVLPKALADEAPIVRAGAALLASGEPYAWRHYFSDEATIQETESSPARRKASPEVIQLLRPLVNDVSPEVQFAAQFSLMALGEPVDFKVLGRLLTQQKQKDDSVENVVGFWKQHYRQLPDNILDLMGVIDPEEMDSTMREHLERRFQGKAKMALSFSELVNAAPAGPKLTVVSQAPEEPAAATNEPYQAVYFFSPGCQECAKVSDQLDRIQKLLPRLTIDRRNIREGQNLLLNQALCLRQRVPSQKQNVTPALFTQIGYLIGDGLPPEKLESLLRDAGDIKPDPDWAAFDAASETTATETVEERFQALNPSYVLAGGLLDGINPCAFATIIFLLSYLKIARRSPREILAVGSAFIIAVFLTYFLIGLALNEMLGWVGQLAGARRILNWIFAGFALVIALLSLRDAWRAAHGRLGDMSLQMPQFLKDRVRSVVRTGARSSRFVVAAFAVGVAITFLELACTGQVYAPIVYAIRQGRASAVGYLLLYNLAFIAPLVIIFALAYRGMTSDRLVQFQAKYTALIKLLVGLLFLGLAILLWWVG